MRRVASRATTVAMAVAAPRSVNASTHRSAPTVSASVHHCQMRRQSWLAEPPTMEWMCPKCLEVNLSPSTKCSECDTRQVSFAGWQCGCGMRNPDKVRFCRRCALPYMAPKSWNCPHCRHVNPLPKDGSSAAPTCGAGCGFTLRPTDEDIVVPIRRRKEGSSTPSKSARVADATEQLSDQTASTLVRNGTEDTTADAASSSSSPHDTTNDQENPQASVDGDASAERAAMEEKNDVPKDEDLPPPGFPWACRACGERNPGTRITCSKCSIRLTPEDWECGRCGSENFRLRSQCFNCHAAIIDHWRCPSCSAVTSVYDRNCRECGKDRPPVNTAAAAPGGRPGIPGYAGRGVGGGGPAPPSGGRGGGGRGGRGGRPQGSGDWMCTMCKKVNFAKRATCISCETPRDEAAAGMGSAAPVGDNNWPCPRCRATNFRTLTECWQCQLPAPHKGPSSGATASVTEDGMKVAEDGTILPDFEGDGFHGDMKEEVRRVYVAREDQKANEGDWVCAKCMHKNFRTQQDCFRCFTPKTEAAVSRVVATSKKRSFKI